MEERLDRPKLKTLLEQNAPATAAAVAVRIESRTNLLFSFEKMTLRDAVKSAAHARAFMEELYDFLHGPRTVEKKFAKWCEVIAGLPRRQTRVLTWPLVTLWGFFAQPERHIFLEPNVTRRAAEACGVEFAYQSKPNRSTYESLLNFAETVRSDNRDLQPRDWSIFNLLSGSKGPTNILPNDRDSPLLQRGSVSASGSRALPSIWATIDRAERGLSFAGLAEKTKVPSSLPKIWSWPFQIRTLPPDQGG